MRRTETRNGNRHYYGSAKHLTGWLTSSSDSAFFFPLFLLSVSSHSRNLLACGDDPVSLGVTLKGLWVILDLLPHQLNVGLCLWALHLVLRKIHPLAPQ